MRLHDILAFNFQLANFQSFQQNIIPAWQDITLL